MSALTDYVNDLIQQAYGDGRNNVTADHITLLTKEDAELLIAAELESGRWDEWISECNQNDEPEPAPVSQHNSEFPLGTYVYVEYPIMSGRKALARVEDYDPWGEFPYLVVLTKENRGVWRTAQELEIA